MSRLNSATNPSAYCNADRNTNPDAVRYRNGAPIRVNWIVSNVSPNGIGATNDSSWSDAIYLSASPTGQGLRQIGSLTHFGALGLGQSYTASTGFRPQ